MQDATCSLKSQGIHHPWSLQTVAESSHHIEESAVSATSSESVVLDQSDRPAQPVDATLNAVASSLSRLALSASDVSPPGLPSSLASVTTTGWPNDGDIFQPSGFMPSATNGLPAISLAGGGVSSNIGANGIHPSFSSSTPQQQQRRAITGHAPLSASDTFGVAASANGGSSFASWNNAAVPSWLQSSRATSSIPTRFGPVHHGRSMSVQNINLTGNAAAPQRKLGNQYMSRGAGGIFGGTPALSGLGMPARGPSQGADQFGTRYPGIDEKSLLASLGQEVSPSVGLEAHWLDLIRSAVQEQVRSSTSINSNSWAYGPQADFSRQFASKGKLPFGLLDNSAGSLGGITSDTLALEKHLALTNANLAAAVSAAAGLDRLEIYSRKVFVGGLPPDIDEDEIMLAFRRFGPLVVDWPHKAESKSYFPPKGYCFLLFQDELSVQALVEACTVDDNKLYWCVSSPTMKDKPVQVRPWNLSDADFVMDGSQPLDPRKTVFVGGVPRPLRAVELAMIMGRLYGGVCYAGIDTDPELKYPKGAGRVAFSSQQSYIAAISARFVQLQHGDIDKRVEVKPYVLDDQICDECAGVHSGGKFAPFFCANVTCLQYYCEPCWARIHSTPGREFHKPLVKEGADRPRAMPFRWC